MSIMNVLGFPKRRPNTTKSSAEAPGPTVDEWIRYGAEQGEAAHMVDGYRHGDWCSAGYTTCSHRGCSKKARLSTIHTDHDCCGRSVHHR